MQGARLDVWATRLQFLWHIGYYGSCCRFYTTILTATVPATKASGSYTRKHPGAPQASFPKHQLLHSPSGCYEVFLYPSSLPQTLRAMAPYQPDSRLLAHSQPHPRTHKGSRKKWERPGPLWDGKRPTPLFGCPTLGHRHLEASCNVYGTQHWKQQRHVPQEEIKKLW